VTGSADDFRGVSLAEEAVHRRRVAPEQAGRAIRFHDELEAGTAVAAVANQ